MKNKNLLIIYIISLLTGLLLASVNWYFYLFDTNTKFTPLFSGIWLQLPLFIIAFYAFSKINTKNIFVLILNIFIGILLIVNIVGSAFTQGSWGYQKTIYSCTTDELIIVTQGSGEFKGGFAVYEKDGVFLKGPIGKSSTTRITFSNISEAEKFKDQISCNKEYDFLATNGKDEVFDKCYIHKSNNELSRQNDILDC